MNGRSVMMPDGRGVPRRAARGDAVVQAGLDRETRRALKRWTKRELRWTERVGLWMCVVFGLVLTGVFLLQIGFAMSGPRVVGGDLTWTDAVSDIIAEWFVALVMMPAGLMLLGAGMLGDGWRRARGRALVRLWRCGVCLYELRGLEQEEDGCLVCPECGAAWRVVSRSEE